VVRHIRGKSFLRNWLPTTHLREMASTMGALARLDLYTTHPTPIALGCWAAWRDAMRKVRIDSHEAQPDPPALTPAQMSQAVAAALQDNRKDLASLLILTWAIGARACDVLQLLRKEVTLSGDSLVVEFRRGKGVRMRDPYTVHGAIAHEPHRRILRDQLAEGTTRWIWHCTTPQQRHSIQQELLNLIRVAGGRQMRQSSIRRGALQHMATLPEITEQDLMHFSGHKQVDTLRRYLGWNKVAATATRTTRLGRGHTSHPGSSQQ
jgi:integrase